MARMQALRGKPELLAIPFYAVWAIINIPTWPWFGDRSIIATVGGWTEDLFVSRSTPVYPVTLLLACVSFLFASILLHRRFNLIWSRSILVGSTFPFGFVSLFEAFWQNTGLVARPGLFNTPPVGEVLIL